MYYKIKSIIILLLAVTSINAQHFEGTFTNSGNIVSFKIKPVGGNITESITYIDFSIRYAPALNVTFKNITPNSTDFPGVNIQKFAEREFNGKKYMRFAHNTGTIGMKTYLNNTEYTVFTVELVDMANAFGDFELVSDLSSENTPQTEYIFSVNNSIGIPITDQTAPYSYFYATQSNPLGSEYVLSLANVALPIELSTFDAIARQQDIDLYWEASSEINLSGYELYRSVDAKSFDKIDFVDYDQRSNGKYHYTDSDVKLNTQYYYYLRAIDLDGTYEDSDLRHAIIRNGMSSDLRLYPNPGKDYFYIESQITDVSEVEIYSLNGISVLNLVQISESKGNGFDVNCEALPTGTYLVKVNAEMKKLVITK